MRKRITSLLLTLVMLLSLVPAMGVTASAEETWETITTYEQFAEAMTANAPRNVRLGADIDTGPLTSGIGLLDTLTVKGQKQLDLNGHTLRLFTKKDALGNLIKIEFGSLTLSDSSEAHTGRILGVTSTDSNVLISVWQNGKFTMNGGKLEVEAGKFRDVLWRRTIDCRYGGEVVINGGTLYVPPKTYERYENQLLDQFLDEFDDLRNGSCGYTLIADNDCKVTITGGTFQGPVRMNASNSKWNKATSRVIITGGTFENNVVLNGAGSKAGDGKVTLAKIKGGTFLGKVQAWAAASFESSFSTPEVVISGGDFSKEFWLRPKFPLVNDKEQEGMAYQVAAKLDGGTFHEGFSADKDSENYVYSGAAVKQRLEAYEIYQLADKLLGQNAIQTGNGTFAAQDNNSYNKYITNYRKSEHDSGGYAFIIKAVNNQPTKIIPNAWGMKSVTLDGDPIDYFKNWNGAAVEITNDTAHTIKFEWKDLAPELSGAGYSYRAECEHYVSGSSAVQDTDTIDADKTSHTITIEKGADPKVYSFDLKLNLEKNGNLVGIVHNQHIVKLVVKQAAVVEPTPTIDGTVYYTSGIVFGSPISIAASVTPAEATKSYQWQRSTDGGSTWTNIEGANDSRYTPTADDMGENVRIRVKITANGYLGEIVGAPLTVSKAANNDTPTWPNVVAQTDDNDAYTKFEITNYNREQECVYTDSPATGNGWPDGGTEIHSSTVTGLTEGKTYYIYTRYKGTDTHQPGSKISSSSVLMDEINRLNQIILTDENNKVYTSYGSGNTIYIQKDTSLTLTATTNPDGANTWSDFTFMPQYGVSAPFSVTAPTDSVVSGTEIPQVTIYGDKAGTGTLAAQYSGSSPQFYGTWGVHVYENVREIGTSAEITVSPSFPDMTMYQGETLPLPEGYTVDVYPEGALENYDLAWRIVKTGVGTGGALYLTSDDNITLENDEIKATASHTAPNKTRIALVAINKDNHHYISSLSDFYVTVTKAPVIELTDVTVAPTKVNLELNKTFQLSAVKQPANAEGTLEWTSDKPEIATVSSTGEVTAVAAGTATITVSCNTETGTKSATCTVLVAHKHVYSDQPYLYLDPGNHYQECKAGDSYNIQAHEFTPWTDNRNGTHSRHCTVCKMTDGSAYTETAEHTWVWVVDHEAALNQPGKKHEECTVCLAKRSENTEIPALQDYAVAVTGGTATVAAGTPITRAMEGVEVTVTAQAPAGKHFVKWVVKAGGVTLANETSATTTFTMPANDVTIEANFEKNASTGTGTGTTTYPITVMDSKNGDVTASHKSAAKGTTVTLTVDPDKGYVLDTLTVLDGKDKEIKLTEKNGKYTFTMPDSKVTVAATFKASAPTGKNPFIDVPAGSYYEDAVIWAVEKGITSGTSTVTFDPNGNCTRAQAVTFLWRAAGSPAPKTKVMPFTDVPSGSYYYDAVLWAVEQGITKGSSETMFSPNATCTRAQIVTFLWRANGSPAVSGNSAFTDVASDAYYAAAVTWAEKNGVTGGIGNGLFGSGNNCTRAQIVTFLYRAMK